ncbi:transglutaminase-like putative cysteine protease [Nonlabens dokdonensis]|jgi:hypothetical protein|uniref:Transglutaminase-like enzyme n=2 Tax=Nonlabens dokdonensis TaxID=328515 RepID=L7W847_NONDD|nr:transglutaminase domain-containing protein [Nonlabens dokdonensis]AGC77850.1 transglutaminase-like enzyme [Nonlabens dokdonensis DSW-6]PZX39620.1 transglutaminase-like putative cysteine protease [Nonlabens dokdonensis]
MILLLKRCFLLSLLFCSLAGLAQKNNPTPQDTQRAKKLKKEFEDDDVVIENQSIHISFDRNNSTGKVEVQETKSTTYFSIASRADIGYSTGYDNESSVEELRLLSRRNKRVYWELQDEAYSTESIFHNDYRVKYGKLTFPLQGYTLTVKEEKEYLDIKYFTSHYFTDSYRIMKGDVTFVIPSWLELELKEYHFDGYDIKRSEKKDDGDTIVTFKISKIEPGARESRMQGNSFIYPHVLLLSKSFEDKDGVSQTLFKETKDLYNWYAKLVSEVEIDNAPIKEKVAEITAGITDKDEQVKAIYYWVQDNIKYIAFEEGIAGFQPDAPQNVFDKRYGDCKGMAILLKTMLVEAGFDARLVWIGTDAIAYDYSTPSLSVDNHMITAIMIDGKPVFLDGTEKFNRYGTFATRIQGKQALIENGNNYELVKVPQLSAASNLESYTATFDIVGDDLNGKMKREMKGEQVSSFLYNFTGLPQDKREEVLLKVLADGNQNMKVESTTPFDNMARDKDILLEYDFKVANAVSNFDNTYYLELDPVRYMSNYKMDDERKTSFQLSSKRKEQKTFILNIPANFKVGTLPEALNIENEYLSIKMKYAQENQKIVYTSDITVKKRLIEKKDFTLWNDSIDQLKSFYDEQIVLKQ